MLTKTKIDTKMNDDLKTNPSFPIPENIKKNINEKWFYLYNWIWEKDVKQSIERDFLKIIKNFWTFFSLFLIIPSVILLFLELRSIFYIYFISSLWLINIFLLIYVTILAIKRSSILRKNSQVILTDSSISINWKINKLNEFTYDQNLVNIWYLFEENLFKESNIYKTKKWFLKQVFEQIWNWYSKFFDLWDNGRVVLIWAILYSIYVLSLWFIYLFWIFFIWIFWIILSFINKLILLKTGHEITIINDNFENIDSDSKDLLIKTTNLSKLLIYAMSNDWKDSLLTKIKTWIEDINKYASSAIDTSTLLKKQIKSSKYKEMFNFSIYNSWIKKQIYIPLKQIIDLLEKNLIKLKENKIKIEKQILETSDSSLQWALVVSKTRNQMKIEEIQKHINKISIYINKLK